MLAAPTMRNSSASLPICQAPKLSPRSALRLILRVIILLLEGCRRATRSSSPRRGIDDAADQIGGVDRLQIEPPASASGPMSAISARSAASRPRCLFGTPPPTPPQSGRSVPVRHHCQARQVGRDHRRDLRIAAGGLAVGEQDDRLALARHLNRTRHGRVGTISTPFSGRCLSSGPSAACPCDRRPAKPGKARSGRRRSTAASK
jgi:hypothetical protein